MPTTRDLFKKIRDTKGTFHAKMSTIKDRNGMDLTEAEDIRRGGKNTQMICNLIFITVRWDYQFLCHFPSSRSELVSKV